MGKRHILRYRLRYRVRLGALAILPFTLALALAAGNPSGANRQAADIELLILSTASNRGEVEPCG